MDFRVVGGLDGFYELVSDAEGTASIAVEKAGLAVQ